MKFIWIVCAIILQHMKWVEFHGINHGNVMARTNSNKVEFRCASSYDWDLFICIFT